MPPPSISSSGEPCNLTKNLLSLSTPIRFRRRDIAPDERCSTAEGRLLGLRALRRLRQLSPPARSRSVSTNIRAALRTVTRGRYSLPRSRHPFEKYRGDAYDVQARL